MSTIFNHTRVSILPNEVVRFEYCPNDEFSDQESLFVLNKKADDVVLNFEGENKISFSFANLVFEFDKENPLSTLVIKRKDEVVYKYHKIDNSGELPVPNKTPIVFPLMDSPRLLLPESGYIANNEGYVLQKDVKDLYLLVSDGDHIKLRKQYIGLTGINELPRLKTFGLISSRYFPYSQKSAMEMIKTYEKNQIPLDTFIVDTDWRDMEKLQGCGYTVNEKLFPNMEDFYRFAHNHKIEVMMNDHPLPLREELSMLDNEEIEYRNSNLTKYYLMGLDGWWYDRNWTCKLNSVDKKIASESLGNYLFHNIAKQFYSRMVLFEDDRERNLVMSNINNIHNGDYRQILDSRSHTFAFQWSGDTYSDEDALRNEIVNLNKCANNMVAYYSSDIGGHEGDPSKQQYIRWMQYGALSPIMRPHCTCTVKKFREPWNYDEETLDICKTYINMRYRLLNVFYTAAFKNINRGLGICSPLYLYYPNDKKCYKQDSSYMLGNSILVSPVTNVEQPKAINDSDYTKPVSLTIFPNADFNGPVSYTKTVKSLADINKFYKSVKANHKYTKAFSFRFKGELRFNKSNELLLKCDGPATVYLNNKLIGAATRYTNHDYRHIGSLVKGKKYKFSIDYVESRKLKPINFYTYNVATNKKIKTYLPEGEWFNMYHRNVYQGKHYVKEHYALDETPIFVKAGSLIALYNKVSNISKMNLKTVVYEYFTSKKETINDFFYEDDGKTMQYVNGEYRKNYYHTTYNHKKYIIKLDKSDKVLDDGIAARDVIFKAHIRDGETIKKVLINGESVRFKRHDHAKKAIPFLDNSFARDSKTLSFKFKQVIKQSYKIELIVK